MISQHGEWGGVYIYSQEAPHSYGDEARPRDAAIRGPRGTSIDRLGRSRPQIDKQEHRQKPNV